MIEATVNRNKPPLDHQAGETLDALGQDYVIVPLSKWADTPIWAEACRRADQVFRKASISAPSFTEQTVLVQEYHAQGRIAFVFAHFGRKAFQRTPNWLFYPCVVKLTPPLKAHLVLTGRWKSPTRH